jgi:hypothetical protein
MSASAVSVEIVQPLLAFAVPAENTNRRDDLGHDNTSTPSADLRANHSSRRKARLWPATAQRETSAAERIHATPGPPTIPDGQ